MTHNILIGKLADEITAAATATKLIIRHVAGRDLTDVACWMNARKLTPAGRLLAQRLLQLSEQDAIVACEGALEVDYECLNKMCEPPIECDLLEAMNIPWAPFTIAVRASGYIGSPDFTFYCEFHLDRNRHFLRRTGPFLHRESAIYRLAPSAFALLETIDTFNALTPEEKTKAGALKALEQVQRLSGDTGLDDYLRSERVLLPQRVKLDLAYDVDNRISLVPAFDGVPAEAMRREFLRLSEVQPIYDLEGEDGTRTRVVVSEAIQEVLKDLQRVRHVGGNSKANVLADVAGCFSEGVDRELIDLSLFAQRVTGIGDAPVRVRVALESRRGDWADCRNIKQAAACITLEPIGADRKKGRIDVGTPENLAQLRAAVQLAVQSGEASVAFNGHTIHVNGDLVRGLAEIQHVFPETSGNDEPDATQQRLRNCRYLIIYTNEESAEYSEGSQEIPADRQQIPEATVPRALQLTELRDGSLMRHQRAGVQWLQHLFRHREIRRGCLLADDMGLGKTLQVLTFLAWCIEEGYTDGLGKPVGPYEPILIVAPLILLDTWQEEMKKYFVGGGDIFLPHIILYEKALRDACQPDSPAGREIQHGVPKLNLERITQNRVVITNYDTVKNYQHSFARIDWSIIVTDEAQTIKDQNNAANALKSLKALFKIVVTGTPVENRLLNLWNLIDYVQPGSLVGSARDFASRYESGIDTLTEEERSARMRALRTNLFFGRSDSFVIRREKESELSGLPRKIERRIDCAMSEQQRSLHIDLVRQINTPAERPHHFKLLDTLRKIYLHPRLLGEEAITDAPQALAAQCPKLRNLIDLLDTVRSKREKVLIFCRDQRMQNILTIVLEAHFGLTVRTINGDTKRGGHVRKQIVEQFSASAGFNLLILSPHVAGVGLTITAANHVVHYDRWWNPAKEAQATDRAYRIGQDKDVYVYHLLATDPLGQFESFDRKLDQLLAGKRRLASDFLLPTTTEECNQEELLRAILDHGDCDAAERQFSYDDTIYDDLTKIATLDGHSFECLVAAIFTKRGYATVLGPLSGDGGADLVVVKGMEAKLVQCKHTAGNGSIDHSVITDLRDAIDRYRADVFKGNLRHIYPTCIGITNGRFDAETRARAARDGVVLYGSDQLQAWIREIPVSRGEIVRADRQRAKNIAAVREKLENIV